MVRIIRSLIIIAPFSLAPAGAQSDAVPFETVRPILEKHCHACHGQGGSKKGGMDFILSAEALVQEGKAVPGKPDESPLYLRVTSDKRPMPPRTVETRPTDADIAALAAWIRAGAAPPPPAARANTVTQKDILGLARDHLRRADEPDRPYLRFLSLSHLHNLPTARLSDDDLSLHRLALVKLLNSLSWRADLVEITAVDPQSLLLAFDLRDLAWDPRIQWHRLEEAYPYGLHHESEPSDRPLNDIAKDLYHLSGTTLPILRGDWFVATASRPPLYHDLLGLPETDRELEHRLQVDVADNVRRGKARRAGFHQSGVSEHNRLVERHAALSGGYWKSYDFKSSAGPQNLVARPLGPALPHHRNPSTAFVHDGGEIIFSLPNGLQGYLLVDARGRRIDAGPIEVVHDDNRTSGSPVIVNGLSCMSCHSQGMIPLPPDIVRTTHALKGALRREVERLYPGDAAMRRWITEDSTRFERALERTYEPWLPPGTRATTLKEPIGVVARRYLTDLDLLTAATELGATSELLEGALRFHEDLRRLGLGPLAENGRIPRETWEAFTPFLTPFQVTARALDLGTPIRRRR